MPERLKTKTTKARGKIHMKEDCNTLCKSHKVHLLYRHVNKCVKWTSWKKNFYFGKSEVHRDNIIIFIIIIIIIIICLILAQKHIDCRLSSKAANQKLKDLFIQKRTTYIGITSQTNTYRIFKQNFQQSSYISSICKLMIKFSTRNHRLPVETGMWQGIPFDRRTCQVCHTEVGDEFYYLFVWPQFKEDRKKYLKHYYFKNPNVYKFNDLMNTTDKNQLTSLCHLISAIVCWDLW